jgi:site-specific recombinase XerD
MYYVYDHNFLPQDLLTEPEVKLMAEYCSNPRNRALILLIYETGGGIGEILSLSLRAISFDRYGAILTVGGKTGGRRVSTGMHVPATRPFVKRYSIGFSIAAGL